jgi:hypothetical protein
MPLITFNSTPIDGSDNIVGNNHFSGSNYIDIFSVSTGDYVRFKAFVENFSDNFSSEWNSESVLGRMDGIATFKSTKREITTDFNVPASSIEESELNLKKISALIQYLYPNYQTVEQSKASTMVSAPLVKIKFANLIMDTSRIGLTAEEAGLLGYLGGITYSPNLEMGIFIKDGNLLPKTYKVSLKFSVIHTSRLGFDEYGAQRTPFNFFPYDTRYDNKYTETKQTIDSNESRIAELTKSINSKDISLSDKTNLLLEQKKLIDNNTDLLKTLTGE